MPKPLQKDDSSAKVNETYLIILQKIMSEATGEKDFLSVLRSDQDWFYNGSSWAPAYLDETESCAEEKTLAIVLLSFNCRSK